MVQNCGWFKEESSQFSMGQTAQTLTCSILGKPHTGLDECPRILLSCFRAMNSGLWDLVVAGGRGRDTAPEKMRHFSWDGVPFCQGGERGSWSRCKRGRIRSAACAVLSCGTGREIRTTRRGAGGRTNEGGNNGTTFSPKTCNEGLHNLQQ